MGRKNDGPMFQPSEYNDKGFAIAFLIQAVGLVAWIFIAAGSGKYQVVEGAANSGKTVAFYQGVRHGVVQAPSEADSMQYVVILAFTSLVVSVIFAALWMLLLKSFPVEMTKASLVMFPCLLLIMTIYSLASGNSGWISLAIVTALSCLFAYFYWDRCQFTAMIVKAVVEIYDKQAIIYGLGVATIFLQALWMVVWVLAVIPLFHSGGLVLVMLLSLFWGMQTISNILYVTAAGVVARHYFGEQKEDAAKQSFQQACTNYFGSICFGSLLIAIIQTLTEICRQAKEDNESDGNAVGAALACVAMCFLSCLESLVEIFNEFSFVYVAIYGIPFMDAAKKTYDLITSSDALVKDSIAGIVTLCGALGVAVSCAVFNFLAAWRLALEGPYKVSSAVIGFVVGFAMMCVVSRILEGGCTTMIVCFEEEPDKLDSELKASFYERKGLQRKK